MQDNAKVSIIMPVYNADKFLDRSVCALLNQTYQNIEILCINDGSKDNSLEILNKYAQTDNRVKVFNQENKGPAIARNVGLDNSTGKYIMFCDADDWYEPDMVEQMVYTIEKQNVDFVICDTNIILDKDHNRSGMDIKYHYLTFSGVLNLNSCGKIQSKVHAFLWKKIFKKSIIDKYSIRFPDGLKSDDCLFIREYVLVSDTAFGLNKKLYNHLMQRQSIMGEVFALKTKDYFDSIKTNILIAQFFKQKSIANKNKLNYIISATQDESYFWAQFVKKEDKKEFINLLIQYAEEFDLSEIDKSAQSLLYYAKLKDIKKVKKLLFCTAYPRKNTLIENLFSIRNIPERGKTFKVLTILGFKIKRTQKSKAY